MSPGKSLPAAAPVPSGGQTLLTRRLGDGPRLVLLHGGPGLDHHVMLPLARRLARWWEVLLPDLPGHGGSQPSGAALPDLAALRERTLRWLEALEPRAEFAIGHSLGGWLLRETLRGGRIRPRAAVLLSPPVDTDEGGGPLPRRSGPRVPGRAGDRALRQELLDFCRDHQPTRPSDEFVEAIRDSRLRHPAGYEALRGQLRRLLARPAPGFRPACPVLVLAGAEDPLCPAERLRRLAAATGDAETRLLPDAGHFLFSIDPEPSVEAIREFLSRAGSTATAP